MSEPQVEPVTKKFDIGSGEIPGGHQMSLTVKEAETKEDGEHRRKLQLRAYTFTFWIIGIGFVGSVLVGFFPIGASAEDKKMAQSVVTLIIGAGLGYIIPKK